MLFAPVRLGSTALSAEVLTADVKNCKHFGQCMKKCPYTLNTPELLRKNLEDYRTFLK